jgi:hypothetical protein
LTSAKGWAHNDAVSHTAEHTAAARDFKQFMIRLSLPQFLGKGKSPFPSSYFGCIHGNMNQVTSA